MRRVMVVAAVAAGLALAVAGTGMAAGGPATVKTRHGKLGTFLVGSNGRTLYLFEKDKSKKSTWIMVESATYCCKVLHSQSYST